MSAAEFFYHAKVFLLALFVTLIPYKGIDLPVMDVKEPDCLLNVEMISEGASEVSLNFVVPMSKVIDVVRILHDKYIGERDDA